MRLTDNIDNLTLDTLLSSEFIEDLFDDDGDEVWRAQKYAQAQTRAKGLGGKGQFDAVYKAALKQVREAEKAMREQARKKTAEVIDHTWQAPEKLHGSVYDTGRWSVTDEGISTFSGKGEQMIACRCPVAILQRMINRETGTEKILLAWFRNGGYTTRIVPKNMIATSQKIVTLSDYGLPVTSENARALVSYLNDFEMLNAERIPIEESTGKFGWHGDEFVPYTDKITFDAEIGYRRLAESIHQHGDRDEWMKMAASVRESIRMEPMIYMAAAFGSILVPMLNVSSFLVNLYGRTGRGKTVSLMLAASIWANPADHFYISESNSTTNALVERQGILNHLPLMVDDLSKVKAGNDGQKLVDLIYYLTANGGKDRLTRQSTPRDAATWSNIILSNMERPLTDDMMTGGAVARVLDFEAESGSIFKDPNGIVTTCSENYGFAGREFVDIVKRVGRDEIKRMVKDSETFIRESAEAFLHSEKEAKQVTPLAILLVADELAGRYLFQDTHRLDPEYCIGHLKNANEVSELDRAYEHFRDVIRINANRFTLATAHEGIGETWGAFMVQPLKGYVAVVPFQFERICRDLNVSPKQFAKWLNEKKLLATEGSQDRLTKRLTIANERGRFYVVKISEDEG